MYSCQILDVKIPKNIVFVSNMRIGQMNDVIIFWVKLSIFSTDGSTSIFNINMPISDFYSALYMCSVFITAWSLHNLMLDGAIIHTSLENQNILNLLKIYHSNAPNVSKSANYVDCKPINVLSCENVLLNIFFSKIEPNKKPCKIFLFFAGFEDIFV